MVTTHLLMKGLQSGLATSTIMYFIDNEEV